MSGSMKSIFPLLLISLAQLELGLSFLMFPCNAGYFMDTFFHPLMKQAKIDLMASAVPGNLCSRKCTENDRKVCHFKFTLEFYHVLGGACNNCHKGNQSDCFNENCVMADGVERGFLAVNRQLPGPPIQVCKDDVVVVDVDNQIDGMATTLHWHGLLQHGTPYSDGVPFLTQCPIQSFSTFRYIFNAREAGTHFYHSHAGLHKANGIYGAILVREEENDSLYDFDLSDFYLVCSDWLHEYAEEYFPGLASRLPNAQSILINGRARFRDKSTLKLSNAPLSVYNVHRHKRYRFRLMNAAFNVCPFQLSIENHNFTIIESDGGRIRPIVVDTLYFLPGERYDIVVDAVHEVRDYWIRISTLFPCIKMSTVEGFAVLRYHANGDVIKRSVTAEFISRHPPLWNESYPIGTLFNKPSGNGVSIGEAERGRKKASVVDAKADHTFYLFFDTPIFDNKVLFGSSRAIKFMVASDRFNFNSAATINNISLLTPPFTLLSQKSLYNESIFCDSHIRKNCIKSQNVCQCIHRLKVELDSVVEVVLVDINDPFTHPFHLHGHKFFVMDVGNFNGSTSVEDVLKNDNILSGRKLSKNPPLKDTILVPNGGYARIKFKADNLGFWIGHCHFDYHLALGMAVIFQVGEVHKMKARPPHFVECNNYMPNNFV